MKDLTKGNIKRHLIMLMLPLILGNILQQMYNTIDVMVIGRYAGELEFSAAVGVASSIMNLLLFVIVGACTGISVIFSQLYGGKREKEFRTEYFLALTLDGLISICLSVIAILALPLLLRITQTPKEIVNETICYLRIVMLGLPFAFLYNLYSALLRSTGNTSYTLLILFLSVLLNLFLDVLMVVYLRKGISGAAWATITAQGLSALLSAFCFNRLLPNLKWRNEDRIWKKEQIKDTLRLGFVTAIHQTSLYIGKMMVQSAVNSTGTEVIAAYTAATRIEGVVNSFGDSGSAATSVVTAQNFGAGDQKRVKKTFCDSLVLLLCMGVACSAILYALSEPAVALVLGQRSGIAFDNATVYLKIIACFYTLCFTGNTFAGFLNGTGRVSIPFIGAASHITLRVVISWRLIHIWKLPAVAVATGIGWIMVNIFWAIYVQMKK